MDFILKGGKVYIDGKFKKQDVRVSDGRIAAVSDCICSDSLRVISCENMNILPGLADVHVHLREPGFSYKETIETGTKACAHGGYTLVCSMPNLNPTPDSLENLQIQLDAIDKDAVIDVRPYGTITVGEKGETLSDMEAMAPYVAGFSDDGRGVQNPELMRQAMVKAKSLGKMIVAHCEDNSLLNGGYIHDGEYAKSHGHKGICSESEYGPIARDLKLVEETGCSYHVCHISTKESVEIIRQAKAKGIDVTCETGPHYLVLSDKDLQENARFKMNPPLRSEEDRKALVEGVLDGTIDMIATDHAPHSAEEKSRGLKDSMMGVVGIETAFSVMYTHFVKTGLITLEKLVEIMSVNPCRRFEFENGIKVGEKANLTVFDLNEKYTVNPDEFLSKGRSTPFEGAELNAKCVLTVSDGEIVYSTEE
ncbi:MAG: dihydroorotase [Clostridia bacterium]|nr:dihydroorotase [Clostridia bacterium]